MTVKGWASKGELYPAYYLELEGVDDGYGVGSGWPIELTEDELADLDRVWDEWQGWQKKLAEAEPA